jgi:hypothetical protein
VSGFDDPFWTSKQVVFWVAFKNRDLVAVADPTTLAKLEFMGNEYQDAQRDTLKESLGKFTLSDAIVKLKRARDDVRMALKKGEIVASYLPEGSKQRVEAGKLHWIDNDFYYNSATEIRTSRGKELHHFEIRLESDRIKERWPAQSDSVMEKRSAEEMAYEEFYREMKASPHKRTRTKDPWVKELVDKFQGLTVTAAKNEWRQAVKDAGAEAWSWSGRPPKKP